MNPRVSVIIPTYQRAGRIQNAIKSVLDQTFSDLEIIVVDDGSSDGTDRILAELFGDQIRYFAQENQGVSTARNRGMAEARGEWIAFLDSDDRWQPEKLELQFKALGQFAQNCGACYTDVQFINHPETRTMFQLAIESYRHEGVTGINTDVLRLLVRPGGSGMVVCLSSFLVRAGVAKNSKGFNPKLMYSEDSEFMFRLAMETSFCYVNRPLVLFDRSPAELRHLGISAKWNKKECFLENSQIRLEGLLRLGGDLPRSTLNIVREQLRDIHSGWTNLYLERGDYRKARKSASRAITTDLNFNVAMKCLLTWTNPRLALRMVRQHQKMAKDSGIV